MLKNTKKSQRVCVYIDGYNLYYGLRAAYKGKYKWLDLQALSESFLQENMTLRVVKYFTTMTQSTTHSRTKQEIYLKALQAHCKKLEIIYGKFFKKDKKCRTCNNIHILYEEKKTDVNIACQLLNDAYQDNYDIAYLVSGDSDLVPPVKIIKEQFKKIIIVAHPPKRSSAELNKISNHNFCISKQKIKHNQLPNTVINSRGKRLSCPEDWQ